MRLSPLSLCPRPPDLAPRAARRGARWQKNVAARGGDGSCHPFYHSTELPHPATVPPEAKDFQPRPGDFSESGTVSPDSRVQFRTAQPVGGKGVSDVVFAGMPRAVLVNKGRVFPVRGGPRRPFFSPTDGRRTQTYRGNAWGGGFASELSRSIASVHDRRRARCRWGVTAIASYRSARPADKSKNQAAGQMSYGAVKKSSSVFLSEWGPTAGRCCAMFSEVLPRQRVNN